MSVTFPASPDQPVRTRAWIWQVSLLSIILGVLLALSLQTQRRITQQGLPPRYSALASRYMELTMEVDRTKGDYQKQIKSLRNDVSKLENALKASAKNDTGQAQVNALHKQIQEYKLFAGLIAVQGPGVEVVLSDAPSGGEFAKKMARGTDQGPEYQQFLSDFMVHDQDIVGVVNELKAAGADAIAVNGQRIIATSSIRCVGPICYINNQATGGSAPYTITAVGSPRDLENGLKLPGGYLDTQQLLQYKMASITTKDNIVIPKYDGLTLFKFAKPAPDTVAAKPTG